MITLKGQFEDYTWKEAVANEEQNSNLTCDLFSFCNVVHPGLEVRALQAAGSVAKLM